VAGTTLQIASKMPSEDFDSIVSELILKLDCKLEFQLKRFLCISGLTVIACQMIVGFLTALSKSGITSKRYYPPNFHEFFLF
jgi:hypothetical protein